jgi:hypothetical protein
MTQQPPRDFDDLSDADLIAFRNEAISHLQPAAVEAFEKAIEERANPNLYRHSRRRK